MYMRPLSSLCVTFIAAASISCGSSSPTAPTSVGNSYAVVGSVAAAIDGVRQSRTHNFLLDAQYAAAVTLTSAAETMLDGTVLSTVVMSISLGTVSDGVCQLIPGAGVTVSAGSSAQLLWTMPAGTDCIRVSDATTQEGPVAYGLSISYY